MENSILFTYRKKPIVRMRNAAFMSSDFNVLYRVITAGCIIITAIGKNAITPHCTIQTHKGKVVHAAIVFATSFPSGTREISSQNFIVKAN